MKINLKEFSKIEIENNQLVLFKDKCTLGEFEEALKTYNCEFGEWYCGIKILKGLTYQLPDTIKQYFNQVSDGNYTVDVFSGLPKIEKARYNLDKVTLEVED